MTLHRSADMRYGEQVFEIPVGLDDVDWASPALAANLADRFHAAHERLYTYALRDQEVVLVNARLSVIGRLPDVKEAIPNTSPTDVAPKAGRLVHLGCWTRYRSSISSGWRQTNASPARRSSSSTARRCFYVQVTPPDTILCGWLDIAVDAPLAAPMAGSVGDR